MTIRERMDRRRALKTLVAMGTGAVWPRNASQGAPAAIVRPSIQLATFESDVTPPIGHACMGGGISPVLRVDDPVSVHGIVLLGSGDPIVIAAIDWCEVRNDAYETWRSALAAACGTRAERVLFTSVHQHDVPVADLEAERILERSKATGSICDISFHAKVVDRAAKALREGLQRARAVSHVGIGKAQVTGVASNRRFVGLDGKVQFNRTSSTKDAVARAAPEGTMDPWLRTLSFWDGERPIAAISAYATHPMSYYGKGGVSADFVGLARKRRRDEDPGVFQIYVSGASGNVTAGKFNDGSPENRPRLTGRMHDAMTAAWKATERHRLERLDFNRVDLRLEPRSSDGFAVADLERRLATDPKPFGQCLAAMGLSWRKRADASADASAGARIDVPGLDFGVARYLVLPGESYVEYQLYAQAVRPDSFVVTAGYGECATGYVPTEKAWEEGDTNLGDWCWVAPGAEKAMKSAIEAALAR